MEKKTQHLVITAMFIAIICVATLLVQIPLPLSGYANLGDGVALLGAYLLGPVLGGIAGGLGSMLADVISGYAIYAPATLIIKGLMSVLAGLLFRRLRGRSAAVACVLSGVCGELLMALGYFGFEATFMGFGLAAAGGLPGNLIQGLVGIAASTALFLMLSRVKFIRSWMD